MTKSISFVSLVAAATAASANRHPPPIADHDDRAERVGLRGLGGWQKVPGHATLPKGRSSKKSEARVKGIEDPRVEGIEKKNEGREKGAEKMRRPNKGGPTPSPVPPPTPVEDIAIHGFPTFAPDEATQSPTSASPRTDTLEIATHPPTSKPTTQDITTPTPTDSLETVVIATTSTETPEADVVIASNALVPPCPPYYSTSSSYFAGDTIEVESNVFACRPPPYEAYCSVVQLDEGWDAIEKTLWDNAWTHVSACGAPTTTAAPVVRTDATTTAAPLTSTVATTSAAPLTTTIASTTAAPVTITVAPAANTLNTTPPEIPSLPPCPDAYDLAKTTYVAGEVATVKTHIFKCGDETYCNIATWDDALLAQDVDAKEKWDTAWEAIGECLPTQMELMEEEAEYDS